MRYTAYIGVQGKPATATGEQRLMLAILEDCLRTLFTPTPERSKRQERDFAWITSEDRSEIFAFENICDALGIDPGYLRSHVLAALVTPPPAADGRE